MPNSGLGQTERFTEMAQRMGAALLYAPHSTSDALKNLGTLTLPNGELKNGAALGSPGLVDEGAAANLDGTNDYIETGWGEAFASGVTRTFVWACKFNAAKNFNAPWGHPSGESSGLYVDSGGVA